MNRFWENFSLAWLVLIISIIIISIAVRLSWILYIRRLPPDERPEGYDHIKQEVRTKYGGRDRLKRKRRYLAFWGIILFILALLWLMF